MTHTCHAENCNIPVQPKMFMCPRHWFMLPKQIRDAIWAAYRPGQEITKNPSDEYLNAAFMAIRWVREHGG
jgi:hypothetical protein